MDNSRLKIKIGDHEFEAEGPTEVVQAQFAIFKDIIAVTLPAAPPPAMVNGDKEQHNGRDATNIQSIMKQDGRIVSLTANPSSSGEAILLILLGQKVLRNNDGVTGSEMVDGLKLSGLNSVRLYRQVDKLAADGHVIVVGLHRGKRYRLTNHGLNRAQEIAKAVIASVA